MVLEIVGVRTRRWTTNKLAKRGRKTSRATMRWVLEGAEPMAQQATSQQENEQRQRSRWSASYHILG
jgi:hypothetical protein